MLTSGPALPQVDAAALSRDGWDVAVVGAGPAGAIAARRLALAGRRVLLLERQRVPRDKTCGDGLIPDALAALVAEGLLARVRAVAWEGRRVVVYSPARTAVDVALDVLTVPRRRLDALLAGAAVEAGATLACGAVATVDDGRDGVALRLTGDERPFRARFAIVATGAHARLAAAVPPAPSAVALRHYLRSRHVVDRLVVSFDRAILPGYAWIFPIGDDTYNVGCGVLVGASGARPAALRAMLERFYAVFPDARALRAAAIAEDLPRGALLRCALDGAPPWRGGRVVAAGETIGTTFPLTGEGIGTAITTGTLAARAVDAALDADDARVLAAYAADVEALRPRYVAYVTAEQWMARPWVADVVAARARRSARLRDILSGFLREEVDPRAVLSATGLVRAMVG